MSGTLSDFLLPYVGVAFTAAYSLAQNLQALGVDSAWAGIYIDVQSMILGYGGAVLLAMALTAVLTLTAAAFVSRSLLYASVVLWAAPGLAAIGGRIILPIEGPATFVIGEGHPGTTWGTAYVAGLLFLFGWAALTIVMGLLNTEKKFKYAYDHIWYVAGLTAAVFFVQGMNAARSTTELDEAERTFQAASKTLYDQLRELRSICVSRGSADAVYRPNAELCSWAKAAVREVWTLMNHPASFRDPELKPTVERIASAGCTDDDSGCAARILARIAEYNRELCKPADPAPACSELPFELTRFAKLSFDHYALNPEAIVPTMGVYWSLSKKASEAQRELARVDHLRWVYLVFFAAVIGGKVATATREIYPNAGPRMLRQLWP
ncbi:MAG TPA: hypothetical protein VGB66_04125 [Longimicrobium sp.]|jgi:hypothetical protein